MDINQPEPSYRTLTDWELTILKKLTQVQFAGRDEVLKQIDAAEACGTGDKDNYGSIYLRTSYKKKASVAERVPVEGFAEDIDRVPVEILLHVLNGYISELEIVKADGSPLLSKINPDKVKASAR